MSCARVLEGSSFLSRAAIALQSRRLGSAPSRKVAVHREGREREREGEKGGARGRTNRSLAEDPTDMRSSTDKTHCNGKPGCRAPPEAAFKRNAEGGEKSPGRREREECVSGVRGGSP